MRVAVPFPRENTNGGYVLRRSQDGVPPSGIHWLEKVREKNAAESRERRVQSVSEVSSGDRGGGRSALVRNIAIETR